MPASYTRIYYIMCVRVRFPPGGYTLSSCIVFVVYGPYPREIETHYK